MTGIEHLGSDAFMALMQCRHQHHRWTPQWPISSNASLLLRLRAPCTRQDAARCGSSRRDWSGGCFNLGASRGRHRSWSGDRPSGSQVGNSATTASLSSPPLLPPDSRPGLLEVTFRDIPVPNPHLVTLRLQNLGLSDVATHHFDSGAPVRVVFKCRFFGLTSSSRPAVTVSPAIGDDGWVELRPTLLRRGDEWAVQAVVEGVAAPELFSPLIDADVVEGASARDQFAEFFSGIVLSGPFGIAIRLPGRTR